LKKSKPDKEANKDQTQTQEPAAQAEPAASLEEIQISFNIIKRLIAEIENCVAKRQGTTILSKDVNRAQQLCLGLLEQHESLAVDCEVDHFNPQSLASNELARAKRQNIDARLKADEVKALRNIFGKFPRNITIDSRYVGRGQREPYLRLMTIAEKAAQLKPSDPVINTVGYIRLMTKGIPMDSHPEVEEVLKKVNSFPTDLNEFILRLAPNMKDSKEAHPGSYPAFPLGDQRPDYFHWEAGAPLQKPIVSIMNTSQFLDYQSNVNEGRQRSSHDSRRLAKRSERP
jgi:hypothetical protein